MLHTQASLQTIATTAKTNSATVLGSSSLQWVFPVERKANLMHEGSIQDQMLSIIFLKGRFDENPSGIPFRTTAALMSRAFSMLDDVQQSWGLAPRHSWGSGIATCAGRGQLRGACPHSCCTAPVGSRWPVFCSCA